MDDDATTNLEKLKIRAANLKNTLLRRENNDVEESPRPTTHPPTLVYKPTFSPPKHETETSQNSNYGFITTQDKSDRPSSQLNYSDLWEGFIDRTTAHGVGQIPGARGYIKKVWWSFVMLGMVALAVNTFREVITEFMNRPTDVVTTLQRKSEIPFPAVTICNINPTRSSMIADHPELASVLPSSVRRRRRRDSEKSFCTSKITDQCLTNHTCYDKCVSCACIAGYDENKFEDYHSTCTNSTDICVGCDKSCRCAYLSNTTCANTNQSSTCDNICIHNILFNNSSATESYSSTAITTITTAGPTNTTPTARARTTSSSFLTTANTRQTTTSSMTASESAGSTHPDDSIYNKHLSETSGAMDLGAADEGLGKLTEEFLTTQTYREAFAEIEPDEKYVLGHQIDDFILECSFRGRECNRSVVFKTILNPVYGNCFTFNFGVGKEPDALLKTYQSGRQFGLQLTLNLEVDEYISDLAEGAGARILAHNQGTMPFVDTDGLSLPPGQDISMGVKKVTTDRLSEPYSDCLLHLHGLEHLDMFQEKYGTNYSTRACQKTCFQAALISQCGCADYLLPRCGQALGISCDESVSSYALKLCSYMNKTEVLCRSGVMMQFENSTIDCSQCVTPCREETYQLSMSSSHWPAYPFIQKIAQKHNTTAEGFRDNFLKVNVYYEDLNLQAYHERPAMTIGVMMSNLGGALGLYIGMSFITALEIVELVVDMIFLVWCKLRNQRRIDAQ